MPPAPPVAGLAARVLAAESISWTCLKGQPHEHAVWRADGPAAAIVVKAHRPGRSFPQELHAYREWLPRLAPATCEPPAVTTPALLAVDVAARALALSLAPGERLSAGTHALAAERTAHAAAGRFARALHDLAIADDDPVPLRDAVQARLARARGQAVALLSPAERAALADLAAKVDAFTGAARVPCHRDFTPDNWMSAGTGPITVIDLEHARLDAPEIDLVKLRAEVWPDRPDLAEAFLAGHGALSTDEAARLDVLLALHAAATLAWADRHADATFRARGRQALAAALASA